MRRDSKPFDPFATAKAAPRHPLEWVFEPLEAHPGYQRRKLFGCEAAYIKGRLHLAITTGEEPWNGLLIATCHAFHASLRAEWRELKPHRVLGKWLYISQGDSAFERVAARVVRSILNGDPRIGVDPKPRRRGKPNAS